MARVMVRFSFPVDPGNELVRSGKIAQIVGKIIEDLKPEAVYLYPEGGQRGGIMVVDLAESSQLAGIAEPFWFGLHATVEITPVMSGEDLQKALTGIETIAQRYA
jgi:hypothetical protein